MCLLSKSNLSVYEKSLLEQGVSSYVVAPLIVDSKFIGIFEITTKMRFDQFDFRVLDISTLVDLVKIATKRRIDHIDESVERRIKSQCTAVHSSVEWIFRRAALKTSQKIQKNQPESPVKEHLEAGMEPIVFNGVYPLYGIVDIRGSSAQRSRAVQRDFLNNLTLIKEVFTKATQLRGLPLIEYLSSRLDHFLHEVSDSMNTNSELIIGDFIKNNLEPALQTVAELVPSVKPDIVNYWKSLDRKHQSFYVARLEFEESVETLNLALSNYIDVAQVEAQQFYPHYFEKHVTDGLDHNIFIGAELAPNRRFDKLYVKNLRLWQLKTMCHLARIAHQVGQNLPIKLQTAQLVVVQDLPITIEFRYDERRFDVRGGYSIRYELIKKRIDKATIKKTGERVTSPGMLVIVFSQTNEREEYKEYIHHLRENGLFSGDIETVGLADLSDVVGLEALRVRIDPKFLESGQYVNANQNNILSILKNAA